MAVTALANIAVKVADVDAAAAWYATHGFEVRDRMRWNGIERADVFVEAPGGIRLEFMEQLDGEHAADESPVS